MKTDADVIVVGSGPAGAQAAHTLVEAGCRVLLLDAGVLPSPAAARVPGRPFAELRRDDASQHHYLLGDDFSGVPLDRLGAAPQVTPPRQHVLQLMDGYARIASKAFAAIESHALGGLGSSWGAVSFPFLPDELSRAGFEPSAMTDHYERIARRIGISGAQDDTCTWRGPLQAMQPPLAADHNASALHAAYERKRSHFHAKGLRVGRPLLAALSRDLEDRRAHGLEDMDFWSNPGGSVYRPDLTIRALLRRDNFRYEAGCLVESFAEQPEGSVSVVSRHPGTREARTFRSRHVLLAAGALGTTRIVLQSFRPIARPVPLVCNTHLYVPCVHLRQLGRAHAGRCHSLAQLTMMYDPTGDASRLVQAQMYSYRSLMLFRLLKESPLPARESLQIIQALAPSLVIWAIEEEDEPSAEKLCRLIAGSDGAPALEVVVPPVPEVEARRHEDQRPLLWGMRKLGCWPIRRVHSGAGSSLHYGGQFPASPRDEPFTTDTAGRLHGTRSVFIADGAAFRYLPAKGLTFTLMANADRVATGIARRGH